MISEQKLIVRCLFGKTVQYYRIVLFIKLNELSPVPIYCPYFKQRLYVNNYQPPFDTYCIICTQIATYTLGKSISYPLVFATKF
jgi:hypothetical protein